VIKGDFWFYDADAAGGGALIDMVVYSIANLVAVLGRVKNVTGKRINIQSTPEQSA